MKLALLSLIFTSLLALSASASIFGSNELAVDFTREAEARAGATWSEPLQLSPRGLGHDGVATSIQKAWIQTAPLAVGYWWRPPHWVGLRVEIAPAPAPITLPNGQTYTPWPGSVFARYSADRAHWSGWHALQYKQPPPDPSANAEVLAFLKIDVPRPAPATSVFEGVMAIPERERADYLKHMETFMRLDVPWTSDEEALARWITTQDAHFFARSIPIIGYVEFLCETDLHGEQPVSALTARVSYGMSGMSSVPRDPGAENAGGDSPWRFRAEPASAAPPAPATAPAPAPPSGR